MGINYYGQIGKIKDLLKKQGYNDRDNIPVEVFGSSLMFLFGMKKDTAIKWMKEFENVKLIRVSEGMVYLLGGD